MSVNLSSLFRKSRRYPIKRDEYGRSARQRAFNAFDDGKRPAEVAKLVEISTKTACRYFADWKKIPKNYNQRYTLFKAIKNDTELSEKIIDEISKYLGISRNEVIERLHKPWAIKQYLMGEWPNPAKEKRQSPQEQRLEAALGHIKLFEISKTPPKQIIQAIDIVIKQEKEKNKKL
jgi:hypothetical protein